MPENTPQNPNSNKKARLGRGLGSLLGGAMDTPPTQPIDRPNSHAQSITQTSAPLKVPASGSVDQSASTTQVQTSSETKKATASINIDAATMPSKSPSATPSSAGAAAPLHRGASVLTNQASAPTQTSASHAVSNSSSQKTLATPGVTSVPVARPINEESQIWMIPVERLAPNTQQPRQVFTPEGLKDLTASVKEKGILQPIVARRLGEREFEIIAGERRWRAAQAAGLLQVPVILKKVSQQDSLELAIIENIQRENLNPIDEAEAYQQLISDYSMTQQQVAEKMGKERSSVANSLRLLALPGEVRMMLKGEQLSTGHAKVLLGLEDKQEQIKIAQLVLSDKLSVRATEKLVAKAKTDARGTETKEQKALAPPDISQRLVEGLGLELQKLIGTKVVIDYADSKGKIAMHFYSDDQFNQMVEKLRKAWET